MAIGSLHQLGAVVRGRREDLGISQADVAERAGVSRKMINELESGRAAPRFSNLLQVVAALDLTMDIAPSDATIKEATSGATSMSLDALLDRYRAEPDGADG